MERAGLGKAGGGRRSRLAGNRQETQLLPQNKSCRRAGARPAPSARWVLNPSPAWHVEASPMGVWLYSFFFFTLFFQPSPSNPSKTHFKKKKRRNLWVVFFSFYRSFGKQKILPISQQRSRARLGNSSSATSLQIPTQNASASHHLGRAAGELFDHFFLKKKQPKKTTTKKQKKQQTC